MKTTKKLFALLLSFALVFSTFTANADVSAETQNDTVTVTLRVEDSTKTLIPSTQITLTQSDVDKINQTFTVESGSVESGTLERIPLLPEQATAAHVIAQYFVKNSSTPAKDLTFSTYDGIYYNVAHMKGEEKTSGFWSYRVDNTSPTENGGSMSAYNLKDGDSVVLFYQECLDSTTYSYTNYSYFDTDSYKADAGQTFTVTLNKEDGYDENYNPKISRAAGETVTVEQAGNVVTSAVTDENGSVELKLDQAGTYNLYSERHNDNGLSVNSRAFATVTVEKDMVTPTDAPKTVKTPTPASVTTPAPTATPTASLTTVDAGSDETGSVKKPSAPKKVKATVKKKKVTLSWKKVKSAKGYVVSVSKKNKKQFKRLALTKKTKLTKKFKKGTYFVKVRSYQKADGKKVYSKYSKVISFKVK